MAEQEEPSSARLLANAPLLSLRLLEGVREDKGDKARSPVPGGMVSWKERG